MTATHNNLKIKKGESNMSLIRRELTILGYEYLMQAYLELHKYSPTNGKFIASRPWLNIDSENKTFTIDYNNYINESFDEYKRDIFLNYILIDDETINKEKIIKLQTEKKGKYLTERLRICEKFMFKDKGNSSDEGLGKKDITKNNDNIFYTKKFAPTITKGPVDDICNAVSNKDNFKKYKDAFDVDNNQILVENYGYEYKKDDMSLTIDSIEDDNEILVDSQQEYDNLTIQLDKKIEEASQYLGHETEKVLRYIQTARYFETLNKPVIDGYVAVIDVDIDDILKAFGQRICPSNRIKILNQLIQISNLNLNLKVIKDSNIKNAKKKTRNEVLYFSSKLINMSFVMSCVNKNYIDGKNSKIIEIEKDSKGINDIDIDTIKKIQVKFSWTDTFEKLYKDGCEFLNLNMPSELYKLPRYKVKDFNLGMYIARLANSTLANKQNKSKISTVGFDKLLKHMNMENDIDNTVRKTEKLNEAFNIIENVFNIFIESGIVKEETMTIFKENKRLVNSKNYKDFKVFIHYQNKKTVDKLLKEDLNIDDVN